MDWRLLVVGGCIIAAAAVGPSAAETLERARWHWGGDVDGGTLEVVFRTSGRDLNATDYMVATVDDRWGPDSCKPARQDSGAWQFIDCVDPLGPIRTSSSVDSGMTQLSSGDVTLAFVVAPGYKDWNNGTEFQVRVRVPFGLHDELLIQVNEDGGVDFPDEVNAVCCYHDSYLSPDYRWSYTPVPTLAVFGAFYVFLVLLAATSTPWTWWLGGASALMAPFIAMEERNSYYPGAGFRITLAVLFLVGLVLTRKGVAGLQRLKRRSSVDSGPAAREEE